MVIAPGRRARRASRCATSRCPRSARSGARAGPRTSAAASKTTSATVEPLVLVGGVGPRVVELVQDVGVDAARAPLAVVGLGRAVALDRHVVRVDLGAARRRTGSVARGGPRRRRPGAPAARAVSSSTMRAADLAADLLAAVGDREGGGQDRLGPAGRASAGSAPVAEQVGNIARQPSGSVVSPFITARASTRWAGVASASRAAVARRPAGPPGSRRRRRPGRPGRRPGTSRPFAEREQDDLREGGQPVDGAMRILDPADLVDGQVDGGAGLVGVASSSPRCAATASRRVRQASLRSAT